MRILDERWRKEGNRDVTREIDFYNLDMIISVGYRVNSQQATRFRIWATSTLKDFIIKRFVLDDERLKQGIKFGKDYFDELLARIREIRASERRFYQKITDIYAQCSIDYDKNAELTKTFYKTVQNKLHWAITGHTAAELIATRANASLPNMGLTTWKNSPEGKVLKIDVSVAKNYLSEAELRELNRIMKKNTEDTVCPAAGFNFKLKGVPTYICTHCGNEETSIPAIKNLHMVIAWFLIDIPNLKGPQLRFLRRYQRLTQEDLGKLLGNMAPETVWLLYFKVVIFDIATTSDIFHLSWVVDSERTNCCTKRRNLS